jgi:hypothetical protein
VAGFKVLLTCLGIPECTAQDLHLDGYGGPRRFELRSSTIPTAVRLQPLPRLSGLVAAVEADVGAIGTESRRRL